MNSEGHLVRTDDFSADQLNDFKSNGYESLDPDLSNAASRKLNGKNEAQVSLTSGGKLSKVAAAMRKKEKVAKKSRSHNRK